MARNLSLLKPSVHSVMLNNEINEKVTYLSVPTSINQQTMQADVKRGAAQFKELDKLVNKEKEPRYIVISADNLEQGYMAITYLAAAFNHKHGCVYCGDRELEENEDMLYEWEETEWEIPVITERELKQTIGADNDPYNMNNTLMWSNQLENNHKPYWMRCKRHGICILESDEIGFGYLGMGSSLTDKDHLMDGLNYFSGNDKVYILSVRESAMADGEDDHVATDINEYKEELFRKRWNYIILSFAADEVCVKTANMDMKPYYKLVAKGFFAQKEIQVSRGFSYEKLMNVLMSMSEDNKCQLMEKIITYATKDWSTLEGRAITNKDFDFMDRFVRTDMAKDRRVSMRSARNRLENELIGLDSVKEQVFNVVNVMKYNKMRQKMNIRGGGYHNVHLMLGAPGTAKTTVAQLMGQLMVEENLLPDDRFACVNGAELKGMYVGHSAPKTKALFEENDIIVIDEAYSIVGDDGASDCFSKEAIAQLIIELENHSMDKLVIFAGYGGKHVTEKNNKMKDFLDANPGIKSRITSTIFFDSYSAEDMVNIFMQIAKNQNYVVPESVKGLLREHFAKRRQDINFGNGREARSLLETAVIYTAKRVFSEKKSKYSKAEMQTITEEDIRYAIKRVEESEGVQRVEKRAVMGFHG